MFSTMQDMNHGDTQVLFISLRSLPTFQGKTSSLGAGFLWGRALTYYSYLPGSPSKDSQHLVTSNTHCFFFSTFDCYISKVHWCSISVVIYSSF